MTSEQQRCIKKFVTRKVVVWHKNNYEKGERKTQKKGKIREEVTCSVYLEEYPDQCVGCQCIYGHFTKASTRAIISHGFFNKASNRLSHHKSFGCSCSII